MSKNVLIVIHHRGLGGGAERIASKVALSLRTRGHSVLLLTFYRESQSYQYDGEEICLNERLHFSLWSKFEKVINRAKAISEICRDRDIDTVISFLNVSNIPTILSSRFFGNRSKIVISERNNTLRLPLSSRLLARLFYPSAAMVVCVSKGVERILNRRFNVKRTKTIYNFNDVEQIVAQSRSPISADHERLFDNGFIFITIGRLAKQKNHASLIRSFANVVEKTNHARLLIIGSGEYHNRLNNLIETMNLRHNVFLLGQIRNVFPYIYRSDVFMLTSNYEGLPNVLIEALSLNKPVISTDCITGPREILCPELEIEQKIDYPYYGKYGVMVEPILNENAICSIDMKPLSNKEKILSQVMLAIRDRNALYRKYENGIVRAREFSEQRAIKEWESVI